jgi:hypothetical protein
MMEFAYGFAGFVIGAIVAAGALLLRGKAAPSAVTAAPVEPPPPPAPPRPSADAVRFLAILQGEARFFDFLMEDVSAASNEQIGSAVREIHAKSQAAIKQHLTVESIMPQSEGSSVTVPVGFDPSRIRVTGNVTGSPPFTGTLVHPGWRAKDIRLAPPAAGADVHVIQPAEVHLD